MRIFGEVAITNEFLPTSTIITASPGTGVVFTLAAALARVLRGGGRRAAIGGACDPGSRAGEPAPPKAVDLFRGFPPTVSGGR